jgi:hypothetical protein
MTRLTEPQIWVLMGLFSTTFFAMLGIGMRMLRMLVESLTAAVRESVESARTEVGTDRA